MRLPLNIGIIPESWRIGLFGVFIALLILLIGGYSFIRYDEQLFLTQKSSEINVQARILAASVTASLVFLDPEATQEYLNALMVNPEIVSAAVYDVSGNQIAGYIRADPEAIAKAASPTTVLDRRVIDISHPVVSDNTTIGRVMLRVLVQPVGARLQGYMGFLFGLILAALLMGVLASGLVVLARTNTKFRAEMVRREHAEESLRHSQKMESVGQLAGGIAHDFNNSLAIVIGSLGLMKLRSARGEKNLDHHVTRALEGAQRAATLTKRILEFSHRQPLNPQQINLNQLVGRVSELLRGTIGETMQIETTFADAVYPVQVDPSQLENVIVNLAINSRDAMPEGGTLTIETSNVYFDESYRDTEPDIMPGQYAMIAVTDTGTGMTAEVRARAYDPFYTTKPVGKGTGLGLSQVYGFVKQSGGHVRIYSEIGRGTTVKVYLPRATDIAAVKSKPASEAIVIKPPGSYTVLVVDDDAAVRTLAVVVLQELGYQVIQANGSSEALRVLHDNNKVDLLFTDIVMPEVNGKQLADEASRFLPELKILYTTGYTEKAVIDDRTIMPLLRKPYTVEQLSSYVRAALLADERTVRH